MSPFSPSLLAGRRARVLEALGHSVMVLPAAAVQYKSSDTNYPYRPDSELAYLTGCFEPGAVAVLRGDAGQDRFVLFIRPRDPAAELWAGARLGVEGATERLGADVAFPIDELSSRLPDLLGGADRIYHRPGRDSPTDALVGAALQTARRRGARKGFGPRGVLDPGLILDDLRLIKTPEEVDAMRAAAALTVEGFRAAAAAVAPGQGEHVVEAAVEAAFRRGGARRPAFSTIVGSGPNACVLHYVDNSGVLEEGDMVLVDAGAELGLYNGDVTRTFPVSGVFSDRQRALYDVIASAQKAAVRAVAPGVSVASIHEQTVEGLTRGLVELGILEGEADGLIESKAYESYYPHQTSHWLGLDTHDVGDYAREGKPRTLEPGMVLTIEPGLYIPPGSDGGAGAFRGMGVRIEDDVLVTDDGHENLTAALPVDAGAVEALVQAGQAQAGQAQAGSTGSTRTGRRERPRP